MSWVFDVRCRRLKFGDIGREKKTEEKKKARSYPQCLWISSRRKRRRCPINRVSQFSNFIQLTEHIQRIPGFFFRVFIFLPEKYPWRFHPSNFQLWSAAFIRSPLDFHWLLGSYINGTKCISARGGFRFSFPARQPQGVARWRKGEFLRHFRGER